MYPFGLYGVKPRALLRKKAAYDPHAFAAVFDTAVVRPEPAPHLAAYVPGSVVPNREQHLLADRFGSFATPL